MKKSLLISLIILGIILVGSFFLIFYNQNGAGTLKEKTLSEKIAECPNDYGEYKKADCITPIAVEYKNTSICSYISPSGGSLGWGDGHECVLQTYIVIGDSSNCDKLRFFSDKCKEEISKNS